MNETKTYSQKLDMATALISLVTGQPVVICPEDRLRGAMIEAAVWLQQGAPSRALETLNNALDRKP